MSQKEVGKTPTDPNVMTYKNHKEDWLKDHLGEWVCIYDNGMQYFFATDFAQLQQKAGELRITGYLYHHILPLPEIPSRFLSPRSKDSTQIPPLE